VPEDVGAASGGADHRDEVFDLAVGRVRGVSPLSPRPRRS
jgi:hypothetical protein